MDIQGDGTKNMNGSIGDLEDKNDKNDDEYPMQLIKKCGMIISTENVEESKEINESKKGIDSKDEHDIVANKIMIEAQKTKTN
ncbi:3947_t:CDS:2 [Entrophospora sp. SA101]|nr:3947_t:CDS:2 [Entrophospora sp. SA101]